MGANETVLEQRPQFRVPQVKMGTTVYLYNYMYIFGSFFWVNVSYRCFRIAFFNPVLESTAF